VGSCTCWRQLGAAFCWPSSDCTPFCAAYTGTSYPFLFLGLVAACLMGSKRVDRTGWISLSTACVCNCAQHDQRPPCQGVQGTHVQHTICNTVGVKQMLHIRRWRGLTLCSSKPTSSSLSVAAAMTARATSSSRALLVIRFVNATCSQRSDGVRLTYCLRCQGRHHHQGVCLIMSGRLL